MKNDNVLSDIAKSIDNVHLQAGELKTVLWLMRCAMEESVPRPNGVSYYGMISLVADMIEQRAVRIDGEATSGRAALHEYMQAVDQYIREKASR